MQKEKFTEKRKAKYQKSIWLNEVQNKNWDSKEVKNFLDGKDSNRFETNMLREMFEKGVLKVYGDKLTPKYKTFLELL